ncbi:uncharacterized protein LOC120000729 [Tripterygium wilfordii]|uniref:uncharacterized protein LOC120000729 n=1 Tax=Tripterygium wilfordii TaxID=458696 RepID=UPI0018F7EEEF|nr:uncharacterized protein LOC120000729 [Tripterygium wilfordii]
MIHWVDSMAARVALLMMFVCCTSGNFNGVRARKLSIEEDSELEKELRLLNKPAIVTIRTTYEEKYDCVDFYKQPAFNHPSSKNHKFDYNEVRRQNLYPKGMRFEDSSITRQQYFNTLWLNGEGCPVGTVPIKQITKVDLISQQYRPLTSGEPGTHYAILRTNDGTTKKFKGAGMDTGSWVKLQIITAITNRTHLQLSKDLQGLNRIRSKVLVPNNRAIKSMTMRMSLLLLQNPSGITAYPQE